MGQEGSAVNIRSTRFGFTVIAILLIALFAIVGGTATKGAADNPATIALNVNINDATGNDAMKPDNPAIPERTGSHTPHGWRLRYRS